MNILNLIKFTTIVIILNPQMFIRKLSNHSFKYPVSRRQNSISNIGTAKSNICVICICKEYLSLINCFYDSSNEDSYKYWHGVQLSKSHFKKLNKKIRNLLIDSENIDFKLKQNVFSSMKNLEFLTLENFNNLSNMPNLTSSFYLKELTIQKSNLKSISYSICLNKTKLTKIDFAHNDLYNLTSVFDNCHSLTLLDLSYNQIKTLNGIFKRSSSLINLNLNGNLLTEIQANDLFYLNKLTELSLAKNRLRFIHENAFDTLKNLLRLDLSKNDLYSIPFESKVYYSIEIFSIYENSNLYYFPKSEIFHNIKELNLHYSYHCCAFLERKTYSKNVSLLDYDESTEEFNSLMVKNQLIVADDFDDSSHENFEYSSKFSCLPKPDPFTPCENLLEDLWLRIGVWLVSILGIISNLCVIIYNFMNSIKYYNLNNEYNVPTFLLTNLATADSLMSIYLLFIALKDATSRHKFGQSAPEWQSSFMCNFAGFLSILSSISSALCLCFITYERFYVIKNSINLKRISMKMASISTIIIWLISLIVALMPLFDINSYSAYAICLPFETKKTSYKVYIVLLNFLLITSFFIICILYGSIFISTISIERRSSLSSCNSESQIKQRWAEDQKLARNILLLVIVNMFCWGPIVCICAYSIITRLPINREYLKILVVFVIPLNSLINPYLYCISRRNFQIFVKNKIEIYWLKQTKFGLNWLSSFSN